MESINEMEKIDTELKTLWLGHHYEYFKSISSTQTLCYELAEKGAPAGTVVCADTQTQGRGRKGYNWESPQGGLWFSLLLRPDCTPHDATAYTLVTAVGIMRGLLYYPGLGAGIKWPNDIMVDGRKICGILSEMQVTGNKVEYVVIGIGININTEGLSESLDNIALGIENVTGDAVDKRDLLAHLLLGLESAYDQFMAGQKKELFEEWEENSVLMGKTITVKTADGNLKGRVHGLSDEGFLVLDLGNGKGAKVISGQILSVE